MTKSLVTFMESSPLLPHLLCLRFWWCAHRGSLCWGIKHLSIFAPYSCLQWHNLSLAWIPLQNTTRQHHMTPSCLSFRRESTLLYATSRIVCSLLLSYLINGHSLLLCLPFSYTEVSLSLNVFFPPLVCRFVICKCSLLAWSGGS